MGGKEPGTHDAVCPRCGTVAEWSFIDEAESEVTVLCPDCGSFDMSREEFDQADSDIAVDAVGDDRLD